MNAEHFTVVAGQEAEAAATKSRDALVSSGARSLVEWQEQEGRAWTAVEIVESIYGHGVRYASGLDGFAIIYGHRTAGYDGSYETALRVAREWVRADPEHRYAFVRNSAIPAATREASGPHGPQAAPEPRTPGGPV